MFIQKVDKHLQESGCYHCGREITGGYMREDFIRFAKGKNANLYVAKLFNENENFYKIGITVQDINIRLKSRLPYQYEIIHEYSDEASKIYDLENKLHKEYKDFQYNPQIKFDGYTECFTTNLPIQDIINNL